MSLPMEKNEKYIQQKREYNSKLSTFQISKELHKRVKEYCSKEKMKVRDFIENLLSNNIK
jgi:hypothetical protein